MQICNLNGVLWSELRDKFFNRTVLRICEIRRLRFCYMKHLSRDINSRENILSCILYENITNEKCLMYQYTIIDTIFIYLYPLLVQH